MRSIDALQIEPSGKAFLESIHILSAIVFVDKNNQNNVEKYLETSKINILY